MAEVSRNRVDAPKIGRRQIPRIDALKAQYGKRAAVVLRQSASWCPRRPAPVAAAPKRRDRANSPEAAGLSPPSPGVKSVMTSLGGVPPARRRPAGSGKVSRPAPPVKTSTWASPREAAQDVVAIAAEEACPPRRRPRGVVPESAAAQACPPNHRCPKSGHPPSMPRSGCTRAATSSKLSNDERVGNLRASRCAPSPQARRRRAARSGRCAGKADRQS